jgi:endo-1,4-beta-xylanase
MLFLKKPWKFASSEMVRPTGRSLALVGLLVLLTQCGVHETDEIGVSERTQAATQGPSPVPVAATPAASDSSCGYRVQTGTYSIWPGGYQAWVTLTNVSGATGLEFDVLLDIGSTTLVNGYQAEFQPGDRAYLASEPSWLKYQTIPKGASYQFGFIGNGTFAGVKAFINTINGQACDIQPPVVDLTASQDFFTSTGTLTLTAAASDNVAVRKVTFLDGSSVLGEDWNPPYTFVVPVSDTLNGRHVYAAKAVDPSGNEGSDSERVLVAVGNRFFGTAVDTAADYTAVLGHFDQITPENGGKWGVVEATRDTMNWTELDQAYAYAEEHGLKFKLHTLFWGQQQPAWLAALSPQEQLEEIHEWLAALAERYEHLPLVEVVNEPLNAPPGYIQALGGAGETGYDWLIEAFELAREYFPHSELLLNEYNVLIWGDFTANYLPLVELLDERKLIDGIGLQGHFLERAELAVVEANLATLAATGLPIYISELDLNLADDAHHANRLKDLLTIFWANPSVVGVTHWGHLQGSTWQPNAYLIRQDGTFRPGFEWALCTRSGGENCTVPPYVPAPHVGGQYGIALEAEEYDDASGLLALGNTVAYTDSGDFLAYADVLFQDNWDTLSIRYAKGNTDLTSSVAIHLDSLESAPVLTVALPPTADWGSFETVEVPWPATLGHRAVYVSFHGGYGIANVDSLRFGTEPPTSDNLVTNGDFESGNTSGWYGWGGSTLTANATVAHSGGYSLLRAGGGTAATDITAKVQAGATYSVSFWVLIEGAATSNVNITRALNCGGTTTYAWAANNGSIPAGTWVELSGSVAIPADCDLVQLQLYAEGPPAEVNLYLDDVVVLGPPVAAENLIANGDFESGNTSGWYGWGGSSLSASNAFAHSGTFSLLRAGGGTAATDVTAQVQAGSTYSVSFWVLIDGAATSNVNITQALNCGGNTSYAWVANNGSIPAGSWVELAGNLAIPADCDLVQLQLYAEGPAAEVNLHLDDVRVAKLP